MQTDNAEKVKEALKICDALFAEGKYEESLSISSAPENQKAPAEILPYVLEMQIRNMMALLQFDSALKLLEQILQYLPDLRDFLLRKAQCQIALARTDEAMRTLDDFSKKMASKPTEDDQIWIDRVNMLKNRLQARKARDLTKIRVRFSEDVDKQAKVNIKAKKLYEFEQDEKRVLVKMLARTKQSPGEIGIELLPRQVKLAYTTPDDKNFQVELDLFAEIKPTESVYDVKEGEVTLELAKRDLGITWPHLEVPEEEEDGPAGAGLTNTKKPWHQICNLDLLRRRVRRRHNQEQAGRR